MGQTIKKYWSEWYAWDKDDVYDIIYAAVPSNNWDTVDIELVFKNGRVDKACMCPYEEYTDDGNFEYSGDTGLEYYDPDDEESSLEAIRKMVTDDIMAL